MKGSLFYNIVRHSIIVVIVSILAVLIAVWNNLSATVHSNVFDSLKFTSENMVTDHLAVVAKQHKDKAKLVDYVLNESSLTRLATEIEVAWVSAVGDSDIVNPQQLSIDQLKGVSSVLSENNQLFTFAIAHEQLFFATELRSLQDNLIIAFVPINQSFVDDITRTLKLNLAFSSDEAGAIMSQELLENDYSRKNLEDWRLGKSHFDLYNPSVTLGIQKLYTAENTLTLSDGASLSIFTTLNAVRISSNFNKLLRTIALFSLLAGVFAIIVSVFVAKRLSRPIKLVTEYADEIASGSYKAFLPTKHSPSEIGKLITTFNRMQESISERESTITHQSQVEPLTGFYNRTYLTKLLQSKVEKDDEFQVIGVCVRGFRHINDTFGNEFGDACMKELARRLQEYPGQFARISSSELIWLPSEFQSLEDILLTKTNISTDVIYKEISISFDLVFGYIRFPNDGNSVEDIFRDLNIVFDHARTAQKQLVAYNKDLESAYVRRLSLINQLKTALYNDTNEFYPVYQPVISSVTGRTIHIEALMRWKNAELGVVSPAEFVPLAEQAGFIQQLTKVVLQKCIKDYKQLEKQGIAVKMSINISAHDLLGSEFFDEISTLLEIYDIPSSNIIIELTESAVIRDPALAKQKLLALRKGGFEIALDDFGTGFSALAYLASMPFDILKIDRSFTFNIVNNVANQKICKHVIELAKDFDLKVTAEGIEQQSDMDFLKKMRCDSMQGFYISKPQRLSALFDFLNKLALNDS